MSIFRICEIEKIGEFDTESVSVTQANVSEVWFTIRLIYVTTNLTSHLAPTSECLRMPPNAQQRGGLKSFRQGDIVRLGKGGEVALSSLRQQTADVITGGIKRVCIFTNLFYIFE